MLWVNYIPEIILLIILFGSLLLYSLNENLRGAFLVRVSPHAALGFCFASLAALVFFWFRKEGLSYVSPYSSFVLDHLSYFGRSLNLFFLTVSGVFLVYYGELSVRSKLKIFILLSYFCIFFDFLFLSNEILIFTLSWLGSFIALVLMVYVESPEVSLRAKFLKQFSIIGIIVGIFGCFLSLFGTSKELIFLFGWLISFSFPLNSVFIRSFLVKSSLVQSWFMLWVFLSGAVFWIRFGLPSAPEYKELVGLIFSLTALHSAFVAMRSVLPQVWKGAALFAVSSLFLLSLVITPEIGMPFFYEWSLVAVPLFVFLGYAHHQGGSSRKSLRLMAVASVVAPLPFASAQFFYALIGILAEKENVIFSCVCLLVWIMLSVAAVQQIASILNEKKSQEVAIIFSAQRKRYLSSIFVIVFFMLVIALTWVKRPLLQLLIQYTSS